MSKKVYIIAIVAFICDQLTKSIVSTYLSLNESINVINNFFSVSYINNTGASWGLLSNKKYFLIILSFIAIIIIFRYTNTFKNSKKNIIGFGLLLGGIIGNLSDRLLFGYVKDFLDFKIVNYNFPIFNLADCFIVSGVLLLIISVVKGEDKNGIKSRRKQQ